MGNDDKRGEDRADELQEVIDEVTSGAAAHGAPAPAGPHAESLREAVHRRMRELADQSEAEQKQKPPDKAPGPDDEGS